MSFWRDYSAMAMRWLGANRHDLICRGDKLAHEWALTFDDGPEPERTEAVAGALERCGAVGTFFLIGEKARKHPEIVRRLVEGGHEIGTHTETHTRCSLLSRSELERELRESCAILEELSGLPVRWFRPPFGALRHGQVGWVRALGLRTALWNINPKDWTGIPAETIAERVVEVDSREGSIVVLHDRLPTAAEAVTKILERSEGLSGVTLSRLVSG